MNSKIENGIVHINGRSHFYIAKHLAINAFNSLPYRKADIVCEIQCL